MASRWLQQKLNKMKKDRMKRAHLRHVKTPYNPIAAREIHQRKVVINERLDAKISAVRHDAPEGRIEANKRMQEVTIEGRWQNEFSLGGLQRFTRIALREGRLTQLSLFFSGDTFVFVEQTKRRIRVSAEYRGKSRAMQIYKLDRITWNQTIETPDTQPSD